MSSLDSKLLTAVKQQWELRMLRLLQAGADPNARTDDGSTALMLASIQGNARLVDALLAHGADPNAANPTGDTALMYAASDRGRTRGGALIALSLLDAGANVNAFDIGRFTGSPLHAAAHEGNLEVALVLCARGADINARNAAQDTPLIIGLTGGTGPGTVLGDARGGLVALYLLERGADVDAFALMCTAYPPEPIGILVAERILRHDVDVNTQGAHGETPLIKAIREGRGRLARLLLARGADPNIRNDLNQTALDIARKRTDAMASVILERGET